MDLFGHEDSDEDDAFDDDEFAVGDEDGYDPSEAYDDEDEDVRASASSAPPGVPS